MAVNQNQFESDQRRLPPNRRLQLTPLRGPEIVAILKADYSSTVISIYRCGATEAQHVGREQPKTLLKYNGLRQIRRTSSALRTSWSG